MMVLDISGINTFIIMISSFIAGMVVFKERKDIYTSWAWIFLLFSIPILGLLIYVFLGREFKGKGNISNLLPYKDEQTGNSLLDHELIHKYSNLIKMNLQSPDAFISTDNEIVIFVDGQEKFNALLEDIRGAKKEINIQYYLIRRDSLGANIRDELAKKAKEGVKVRVLYDEVGSRRLPRSFFKELISFGGEVEILIPSFL